MLSRIRPFAAIFFILVVFASPIFAVSSTQAETLNPGQREEIRVVRVIDGDTIVLEDGRHVRYIGIDTPEKGKPYYGEAKRENERLVNKKTVKLEYDVGKIDRYGRTLAYVYVGDIFVNAELVKGGYAVISTYPPNVKYVDTFRALQEEARKGKRGLWGLKSGRGSVW